MTPAISEQARWTIADLEGFPDNGNRYEIIDGELFVTRASHLDRQDVAGAIYVELRIWSLQSGVGEPFWIKLWQTFSNYHSQMSVSGLSGFEQRRKKQQLSRIL